MAKKISTIVFDHDGVIVRLSELVKMGAWGFVANHPDIGSRLAIAEAEEYYGRAKGNRHDILRRAFERLGKPADAIPALVKKHAERFNTIVQAGIRALGVEDEDKIALRDLSKDYALYINSGTTEPEMNETVKGFGIHKFFKGIYGQPTSKLDNLKRAMQAEKVTPKEMLFVGDSDWDFEAAKEFGCHFVGLANSWNEWDHKKPFPIIRSFSELRSIIAAQLTRK